MADIKYENIEHRRPSFLMMEEAFADRKDKKGKQK